jgi:hypothetical protein
MLSLKMTHVSKYAYHTLQTKLMGCLAQNHSCVCRHCASMLECGHVAAWAMKTPPAGMPVTLLQVLDDVEG